MKKPIRIKKNINQEGILYLILGFVAWVVVMFNLNVF